MGITNSRIATIEAVSGFGDLTDTAMSFLDSAVRAIKIDSTFGPPIYIPSPFRKDAETSVSGQAGATSTTIQGKGFDIGRILKPKITFEMRQGWGKDRAFAPYGNPGPSKWGVTLAVAVGILILAGYGGVSLARRKR